MKWKESGCVACYRPPERHQGQRGLGIITIMKCASEQYTSSITPHQPQWFLDSKIQLGFGEISPLLHFSASLQVKLSTSSISHGSELGLSVLATPDNNCVLDPFFPPVWTGEVWKPALLLTFPVSSVILSIEYNVRSFTSSEWFFFSSEFHGFHLETFYHFSPVLASLKHRHANVCAFSVGTLQLAGMCYCSKLCKREQSQPRPP